MRGNYCRAFRSHRLHRAALQREMHGTYDEPSTLQSCNAAWNARNCFLLHKAYIHFL